MSGASGNLMQNYRYTVEIRYAVPSKEFNSLRPSDAYMH